VPLTPARRSSSLWLRAFNVDTHRLRRTTTLRSRRWETALRVRVRLRARVERWCAVELTPAEEATAGADPVDAGGVWAGGVTDGVDDGDGDGDGVAAAGGVADGALAGGGLFAGAVAVGAGGADPGTVTVTAETPGVVVVAAPLRNGCTANTTNSAIVSSALSTIGRRAFGCPARTAATSRCSLGV
jgi:hypothetical protein